MTHSKWRRGCEANPRLDGFHSPIQTRPSRPVGAFHSRATDQEGRIPPAEMLDPASITRNILADKPRVTRFPIDWNASPGESGSAMAEAGPNENAMEEEEEEEVGQGDGDDMVADDADEEMAESGGNAEEEAVSHFEVLAV